MDKDTLIIKLPRVNPRMHYMLFAENSPFKQKVVNRKNGYKRKDKHPKRNDF